MLGLGLGIAGLPTRQRVDGPDFDADFRGTESLPAGWTHTRASTATYFNEFGLLVTAAVDEPVFEYDPVTGESLGLRTEKQATNMLLNSTQLLAGWSEVNLGEPTASMRGRIMNAAVAPDGTMTATKLISSPAYTSQRTYKTQSAAAFTATDSWSIYAKADGYNYVRIQTSGGVPVVLNLLNGELVISQPGCKVKDCGNGWYRLSGVFDFASNSVLWIALAGADGDVTFLGDGVSGIYVWGGQSEIGPVATSFIPTLTVSQETRAQDYVDYPLSPENFNPTEGTFYLDRGISLGDLRFSAGLGVAITNYMAVDVSSSLLMQAAPPTQGVGGANDNLDAPHKYAVTWRTIDAATAEFIVARDGVVLGGEVLNLAEADRALWALLTVGRRWNNTATAYPPAVMHTHSVALYKRALSTGELIGLTR